MYFYTVDGELDIMMDHTKYMVLLAQVYQKSARLEYAIDSLTKAREMQARLVNLLEQICVQCCKTNAVYLLFRKVEDNQNRFL